MNTAMHWNHPSNFQIMAGNAFRFGTSASLAVLVTGMLLFFMCSLIAMDPPEIVENPPNMTDVIMTEERTIEDLPEQMEERPAEPQEEPQMPDLAETIDTASTMDISMAPTLGPVDVEIGGGSSSGTAMAIFRVAPQYPRRAATRGIEGFVDLMFDITPTGKTENIRVIHAEPKGYFERASRKTLAKWKYKPAMEDGVAVMQKNQTTRITYELDK